MQAFTHLYPLANYNLLRQIDRPELPLRFARDSGARDGPARGPRRRRPAASGPVERDDLIVQMADFCLQFEGVEWVAVSGKLGANLVIAVRNHGTGRRNAGEVVRKLFGEIGSAGGHRNMAKAVIPLKDGASAKTRPATATSNRGCANCSPRKSAATRTTTTTEPYAPGESHARVPRLRRARFTRVLPASIV